MAFAELATTLLVFSVLAHAAAVALIWIGELTGRERFAGAIAYGAATAISGALIHDATVVVSLSLGLVICLGTGRLLSDFSRLGALLLATHLELMLGALLWSLWFIMSMPVGALTRGLILAGFPLLLLRLRAGLVSSFEIAEILCRTRWRRPRDPLPITARRHHPMVSLHVPVHAEPPEMVIATLDALAALEYPNFEVLVVDNNTADPRLWRPVENHCRSLGARFRFLHQMGVPGAKAGALNLALRQASPNAELVGLVDSDYQVEPDFLSRLIGHFDDPSMGFVQSPHDYRGWEHSHFLRMCYWEYRLFFQTALPSLNERDAAFTVGTMCLFRRRALEEAGGWAEWCVTEDSEIAVRIHALGYSSVYVRETFGRGLIPETFAGYKQQRYRWTYGPVQELKHHLRLLLPPPLGRPSALTAAQRFYHLNHGVERTTIGLGLLFAPVGVAVAASMAAHREAVPLPAAFLLAAALIPAAGFAVRALLYRRIGCSLLDNLGALVATAALSHTVTVASITGLITRQMPWRRTSKFASQPIGLRCLGSAMPELLIGMAALGFGAWMIVAIPHPGLLTVLGIGLMMSGLSHLAAPSLALLADREAGRAPAHGERARADAHQAAGRSAPHQRRA